MFSRWVKKLNDLAAATQSLVLTRYMIPPETFGSQSQWDPVKVLQASSSRERVQSGCFLGSICTAWEPREFLLETIWSTFGAGKLPGTPEHVLNFTWKYWTGGKRNLVTSGDCCRATAHAHEAQCLQNVTAIKLLVVPCYTCSLDCGRTRARIIAIICSEEVRAHFLLSPVETNTLHVQD